MATGLGSVSCNLMPTHLQLLRWGSRPSLLLKHSRSFPIPRPVLTVCLCLKDPPPSSQPYAANPTGSSFPVYMFLSPRGLPCGTGRSSLPGLRSRQHASLHCAAATVIRVSVHTFLFPFSSAFASFEGSRWSVIAPDSGPYSIQHTHS